jgi:DNA invertase Pin-like site-specific DNA recombinase
VPKQNQPMDSDQENPRTRRVAIYLREPGQGETDSAGHVPSIHYQRLCCRRMAAALHAEVIGEFVDVRQSSPSRPELRRMLDMVGLQAPLVNYLVAFSLDRLAGDLDEAFEVAWHLGQAGTIPMEAMTEDD